MKVMVTGSAGFIGYHVANALLSSGAEVLGYDGFTPYYDVTLKRRRHEVLAAFPGFTAVEGALEDVPRLAETAGGFAPDIVIHLAAQAGVRHSLEKPRDFIDSNIIGTFNVTEIARQIGVKHLLLASSSSVYGNIGDRPCREADATDRPMTIYGATKKTVEVMAHAQAHLWALPTTVFRFFTVYGPWGRPDMALFKFVSAILDGRPIDLYNRGEMYRDFTYVDDLVRAIMLLVETPPPPPDSRSEQAVAGDSLSPLGPHRVVNIGNSAPVYLLDFVDAIEAELGIKAQRNYVDHHLGEVTATWADASLLQALTGYRPETEVRSGIARFVEWYRAYYDR